MRAVNLLPRDDRRDRRKAPPVPALVGVVLAVLLTVALSAGFLLTSGKVADKRQTAEDLRAELAALPPAPAPDTASAGLTAQKQQRIGAVGTALSRRVEWDRVLREVALVLPEDVWLSSLSAKAPFAGTATAGPTPAAPGAAATGFTVNGFTYSQESVARLLTRLALIPDLTNVQLQSSAVTRVGEQSIVQFTMLADVRGPGSSS